MSQETTTRGQEKARRTFLRTTGAAVGAGLLATAAPSVHAAGSDLLKVGLVGCGGRGTGAAADALQADKNVKLTAMGDVFSDRLQASALNLKGAVGDKFAVAPDKMFVGFDAYKQVIDSGVDVVVLATPPHFRPAQLKYAVEKSKHVFAEKPVAVDAPGVRSVLATCEEAKKKNLAVVSGLCWRYHPAVREVVKRLQDGAVGKIVTMQANYNTGGLWKRDRQPGWTDMEWQLRNWLYFTWLSGDHNVEQHIHTLDKLAWVMGDQYPVRCVGLGGRQARVSPDYGQIFDHHAVCYEYANGVRGFSYCRQQERTASDTEAYIFGSEGTCRMLKHEIDGKAKWKWRPTRGQKVNMYQNEHDEMFASIRAGKPINNGDYMAKSTLMAIMGRMATYTGQAITWEMALESKEDLTPGAYEFGTLLTPPIAVPGLTKFT